MRSAANSKPDPSPLPSPEFARSLGVDMETDAQAVVRRFGPIAIRSHTELAQAALDRQDLGDRVKRIIEFFRPMKDAAYKLHKSICDRERTVLAPLEAVDGRLKNAILIYKADEDRRRRTEEARLAEQRRQEEQGRLAAEAAALEQAGERVLAEAVLEAALDAPPPVVVLPDTTKVEGLSYRRVWKWRWLHNDRERALQLLPREYMCPDEPRITKVVTAMKDVTRIPGIEVYYEDIPVRR